MQERADDAALIELGFGGEIQSVNAVQGTVCPVRTSASMAATESGSADCRRTEKRASASLALRLFMVNPTQKRFTICFTI
jgi:hypothetical protein